MTSLNHAKRKMWDCRHSNWKSLIQKIKNCLMLEEWLGTQLTWVSTLILLFVLWMTECRFLVQNSSIILQSVWPQRPWQSGILPLHFLYWIIQIIISDITTSLDRYIPSSGHLPLSEAMDEQHPQEKNQHEGKRVWYQPLSSQSPIETVLTYWRWQDFLR